LFTTLDRYATSTIYNNIYTYRYVAVGAGTTYPSGAPEFTHGI